MEVKSTGKQIVGRHASAASAANRDLWGAVRTGTVRDVDIALAALKKSNGSIDCRDRFGSTAMHIATWRNHVPIARRLLAAGADPDVRDGESGWGSLHRALHFGHLAVAGALMEGGASLGLEDAKGRIPVDLVSGPIKQAIASTSCNGAVVKELFSWGNGSNYQLGTGTAGIQRVPCRVEALHGVDVIAVAAAKFHSVAVTSKGEIFSWGYGRGGRLGHEDYSGEAAVITPRQITSGISGRRVKTVAAAKHHTIVATEGGEVYTWGTNREGQLGYPAVDTQSTPRRVTALKAKAVAVAAANKHSAAVTECGEVYTWGSNREGQLGYGTSNSASNCVPRIVDYLKGKKSVAISTAKYHTMVLVEGEVFTWGYRMVSPRRVALMRNTKKAGALPLKFHQSERLQIVAIAAGFVHSTAISADGLVFSWLSADPNLHAQQVLSMTGHQAVSVSAGKYRTAIATSTGGAYAWDSDSATELPTPQPLRIHGIKRVLHLAVGETHSLAVTGIYVPTYASTTKSEVQGEAADTGGFESDDEQLVSPRECQTPSDAGSSSCLVAPSLRNMCQEVIAKTVLEPRNALQLLEFSDSLGAEELRRHCERLILHNLDYMLVFYAASFGATRSSVLADLEKSWDACSSQPWSHRQLPVPSATTPAVVDSEEDDQEYCANPRVLKGLSLPVMSSTAGFLREDNAGSDRISKQVRAIRKKLQQIEALEVKLRKGQTLDEQQMAKLRTKSLLLESLRQLERDGTQEANIPVAQEQHKEGETEDKSKRQRRKSRKNTTRRNESDVLMETKLEQSPPASESASLELTDEAKTTEDPDFKAGHHKLEQEQPTTTTSKVEEAAGAPPRRSKTKCKKGGLSMFLKGGLDNVPSPPVAKAEGGPAWGGAIARKEAAASLWEIQSEQQAESSSSSANRQSDKQKQKGGSSQVVATERPQRAVSLQQFVRTSPAAIPGAAASSSTKSASSPKSAPWMGTSPGGSVPSLRDIQMQEAKHKEQQRARAGQQIGSPPVVGFALSATSTPDSSTERPSCWFKPDTSSPSSIRCIQIEERAMKDLRRLYKNVKMVSPHS